MGRLLSVLMFPVSCLILLWVAGSGSMRVLQDPTCFSDYISISTCEWEMAGPTNCRAELHLSYQLNFYYSEKNTCVPENRGGVGGAVCTCHMQIDNPVREDIYQLDLWAGGQLLWNSSFKPSEHVKPLAPRNLTVHADISHTWLLTWNNPYPSDNLLCSELTYLVNVSNENDPTDVRIYNVTYVGPTLRVAASTLKSGASYSARVKAWAQSYNSTWSEWSPSIKWLNYYGETWEQRLQLGVGISCVIVLAVCVSCYISIIKIKKEWWDQIPNPAHSPLVAVVIQDSQETAPEAPANPSILIDLNYITASFINHSPVRSGNTPYRWTIQMDTPEVSLWGKRSRGQEPAKCPHWKTCLAKLLPCLLEHGMERDEDFSKAARNGPSQGPGKVAWCPVEVSKTILRPESISVVRCVELFEAQVEKEEEEVEEDKGSFCPSPENSGGLFQEGREDIAARLTESLFLHLLRDETGGFSPQGVESCLHPPLENANAQRPWAEFPRVGPQEASSEDKEQPLSPESSPPATATQKPASLPLPETPAVISDNPAYRSFSTFLSQSSGPGELDSDPQLAECLGKVDPDIPATPQPEPETWEQILRQRVLQHGAAPGPASAPSSGYREFVQAVKEGGARDSGLAGFGPSEEAGYKAFSSLLASSDSCPATSGVEPSSGEGGYKPFQSLSSACPGTPSPIPIPLFTFGLDLEPPHSPQDSEWPELEPAVKGDDGQKPFFALVPATDPLRDDLGNGIVYSALTCHLCGHLKQCHSQEEAGKAQIVASPCCGCCCGDRSSPLLSPLKAPDSPPQGAPLEASLSAASLAPLGVSEEGKCPLFNAPSHAQSSGPALAVLSPGPTCMDAS